MEFGKNLIETIKLLLLISLIAICSLLSVNVQATELNQAGIVDDFMIPELTENYKKTHITVDFSSKIDYQVKPNDTLSLLLPSHLRGVNAYDIPVIGNDNVTYGYMNVIGMEVTVVFNENVSNYKTISGKLTIPVSAYIDVDSEGYPITTPAGKDGKQLDLKSNLGTDLPEKDYAIWGTVYVPGTGNAKMFFKTGGVKADYNYDVIEYRVHVKAEEYDVVQDISFIDTLDENQYIPDESEFIIPKPMDFMEINYVTKEGSTNKRLTIKEFEEQGYGTYEKVDDRTFKMTFDKDKANGYLVDIYYRVKLTDVAKTVKPETVRNDITETYHRAGQEEKIESTNAIVSVDYPDATARPIKGTLWIIKKKQVGDTLWSQQPLLPGVTFNVYKEDDSLVSGGENLVTDLNGRITLPDLPEGNYYVKEISAPEGIIFDKDKKYEFTIDDTSKYGVILAISNKALPPKGEFISKKEASKRELIPGETFSYKITVTNTVKDSILRDLTVEDTMPDGIEIVGNLKLNGQNVGTIVDDSFKVIIPELKGEETAEITIDVKVKEAAAEGEVINIATVTNPEDPDNPQNPEDKVEIFRELDLRIIKTGMDGKSMLKGAVFDLYQVVDNNEILIQSLTTDTNGIIDFKKVKSGTFIIKEKVAPNGYKLLNKSIKITIDKYGVLKLLDSVSNMVSLDKINNTFQLNVKNEEEPVVGGVLPQTGGNGHVGYLTTGVIFMIVTASLLGYYLYHRRKGWES